MTAMGNSEYEEISINGGDATVMIELDGGRVETMIQISLTGEGCEETTLTVDVDEAERIAYALLGKVIAARAARRG